MPARKAQALSARHATKEERELRAAGEAAMMPETKLTAAVPAALKKYKHAAAVWRKLIKLYGQIDGVIVTAFDENMIVKYCKLEEEVLQLEKIREITAGDYDAQAKAARKMKGEDAWKAWVVVNALSQRLQGWDARLDGKRKLLHTLEQSLYMTPRSRAGVAPPEKEHREPDDPMAALLDGG